MERWAIRNIVHVRQRLWQTHIITSTPTTLRIENERSMKPSTKRIILRIVHLVAVIPVLGYVYQPVAEAEQYQRFTQLVFIPVAILAGYWMYMGLSGPSSVPRRGSG